MSWTDERVEWLKELWATGISASQIAKTMGGITRNAVIGKVHRIGLEPPAGRRVFSNKPRSVYERRRKHSKKGDRLISLAPKKSKPMPIPTKPPPEFNPRNLTITDLDQTTCKWPLWKPGETTGFYCGSKKSPDAPALVPYCETHCRMAYQPKDRRASRQENYFVAGAAQIR